MLKRLLLLLILAAPMQLRAQVELIAIHGKIWTENPAQPEAEAIAVSGHRILAVGTTKEIERFAGPETKVIDLKGRRVVPGFNDAHVHFFWGGQGIASVQLRDVTSREQFAQRIAAYARTRPSGEWIRMVIGTRRSGRPYVFPAMSGLMRSHRTTRYGSTAPTAT